MSLAQPMSMTSSTLDGYDAYAVYSSSRLPFTQPQQSTQTQSEQQQSSESSTWSPKERMTNGRLTADKNPVMGYNSYVSGGSASNHVNTALFHPGMKEVPVWLKALRLHKYTQMFQQMTYSTMMSLDDHQLEHLQVTKGARKKIIQSLEKLRERVPLLKQLEKCIDENGDTRCLIFELRQMMNTPICAYSPPSRMDVSARNVDGMGLSAEEVDDANLPGHIVRILQRLNAILFNGNSAQTANLNIEDEYVIKLLQTYDKLLNNDAFTSTQKQQVGHWKRILRRYAQEHNMLGNRMNTLQHQHSHGNHNHGVIRSPPMSSQSQYVMTQRVNLCSPVSTVSSNDQVHSPPCSAVHFYPNSTSPSQQQMVNNENVMWNCRKNDMSQMSSHSVGMPPSMMGDIYTHQHAKPQQFYNNYVISSNANGQSTIRSNNFDALHAFELMGATDTGPPYTNAFVQALAQKLAAVQNNAHQQKSIRSTATQTSSTDAMSPSSRQPTSNNPNNLRPLTSEEKLNFISELTNNTPYSMRNLALQLSQIEQQNAAAEHSKMAASHSIPSAQEAENRYWSSQQHPTAAVTSTGSQLPALVSLRSSNTSKPSAQSTYGLWQNSTNCQQQQHSVMQPPRMSTSRLGSCSSTRSDYSSSSSDRSSGAGSPGLMVYNFDPPLLPPSSAHVESTTAHVCEGQSPWYHNNSKSMAQASDVFHGNNHDCLSPNTDSSVFAYNAFDVTSLTRGSGYLTSAFHQPSPGMRAVH
jgi:hypothetical protein